VIGFKRIPAICVELSALFGRTYRLIVSERAFDYLGMSVCVYMCFVLHRLADVVVTNSKSQYDFINEKARWLRKKTVWIPNTVDLQQFYPAKKVKDKTGNRYKLLVLAKFSSQKNPIRFINAVHMFKKSHPDTELTVDWYGSNYFVHGAPTRLSQTYMDVKAEIQRLDLQKCVRTHEPVSDVLALLHECDVVCLPSIYEGYANAIGEAIACGKPVIASRVSDNPLMVKHGINGFLFDPYSIADIAKAITSFISLTDDQKETMGNRSRELAEKIFSPNAFLKAYLKVI